MLQQNRTGILPSVPQCNSKTLTTLQNPSDSYQNITIDDLCSVKLDNSESRKLVYGYKVSQPFTTYPQDPATGSFGQIPSQTFLPSLAHKNIICLTGRKSQEICEKYHPGQSPKTTKSCEHVSYNSKKSLSPKVRSSALPTEDLNLPVNWGTAKLSLSKRHNNSMGKLRQRWSRPPRRPAQPPLQTQSAALSLIMEGIQLWKKHFYYIRNFWIFNTQNILLVEHKNSCTLLTDVYKILYCHFCLLVSETLTVLTEVTLLHGRLSNMCFSENTHDVMNCEWVIEFHTLFYTDQFFLPKKQIFPLLWVIAQKRPEDNIACMVTSGELHRFLIFLSQVITSNLYKNPRSDFFYSFLKGVLLHMNET